MGVVTFPKAADILKRRLRQLHTLLWPIPAAVLVETPDKNFDA